MTERTSFKDHVTEIAKSTIDHLSGPHATAVETSVAGIAVGTVFLARGGIEVGKKAGGFAVESGKRVIEHVIYPGFRNGK